MKNNFKHAFTLVELMVVIMILAVLSTVAFISFQGYTSSTRDAVRLADLKNITQWLNLLRSKSKDLPLPENKIDISSSGTIFQYQWELSQNILQNHLNILNGWVDPSTGENYGYAVNSYLDEFQVIWFLENSNQVTHFLHNTSHADNTDKFVKTSGDSLGIILDETTNEVITQNNSVTEIDIQNTTQTYAFVARDVIEKWSNDFLKNEFTLLENPVASCKAIYNSGKDKWNGFYIINPENKRWAWFEVYCDMQNYDGGRTLLLANREDTTKHTSSSIKNLTTLPNYDNWNLQAHNSIRDLDAWNVNIVSQAIENMKFQDIRFECLWSSCLWSWVWIYTHSEYSKLWDKSWVFTLKWDKAWPFDYYRIYKTSLDYSESNKIPFNELQIDSGCVWPTSTREYEACVQIGIKWVDYYNFQNSIGLWIYWKEWYNVDDLEINAPFWYIRHRMIENFNANIWVK